MLPIPGSERSLDMQTIAPPSEALSREMHARLKRPVQIAKAAQACAKADIP